MIINKREMSIVNSSSYETIHKRVAQLKYLYCPIVTLINIVLLFDSCLLSCCPHDEAHYIPFSQLTS